MGKGDIDMVQIKYDIVGSFLRPEQSLRVVQSQEKI